MNITMADNKGFSESDLEVLLAHLQASTPGDWTIRECAGGHMIEVANDPNRRIVRGSGGLRRYEDAAFISTAHRLLPRLLGHLEQLYYDLAMAKNSREEWLLSSDEALAILRKAGWRAPNEDPG